MSLRQWWPVLVWASAIGATSSTVVQSRAFTRTVATASPVGISERDFAGFWAAWWWLFVKGFHVLEFACLTWLLLRALRGRVLPAALMAGAFAALDEFHQKFVPGRGGLVSDVFIDIAGVVGACILWTAAERRRATKRTPT